MVIMCNYDSLGTNQNQAAGPQRGLGPQRQIYEDHYLSFDGQSLLIDGIDHTREWLLSELGDPIGFAREWLDDEIRLEL